MDLLHTKSDTELYQSLLAETAKAKAELKCLLGDADKINNRLSFNLLMINELLTRNKV